MDKEKLTSGWLQMDISGEKGIPFPERQVKLLQLRWAHSDFHAEKALNTLREV